MTIPSISLPSSPRLGSPRRTGLGRLFDRLQSLCVEVRAEPEAVQPESVSHCVAGAVPPRAPTPYT